MQPIKGIDKEAWDEAVRIGADEFTDPSDYEGTCVHFRDCTPTYCAVSGGARTPTEGKMMDDCKGYLEGCRFFRV
jgi:hypothetical protein